MNQQVQCLSGEAPQGESQLLGCLLDFYQPASSVYFSSASRTLLAQPPFASLLVAGMDGLVQQVDESLRFAQALGFRKSVVVGAIPFDVSEQAYLRVSTNMLMQNQRDSHSEHNEAVGLGECQILENPNPCDYMIGVKDALQRFAKGELDKVVLSRTLEVECEHAPNVRAMVKNLSLKNAHGYTFAVDLKQLETSSSQLQGQQSRTLIGASPELLISRKGNRVIANPLAGTEPRSDDPVIDQQRAQSLLNSEKDLREHALVIEAIETVLRPLCKWLKVPQKPSLVSTETLWHLATSIEGELLDGSTSSLALALALHPTPAVCGFPRKAAHNAINEIERHDRDLFTGMVGWCDESGDGEWVVTIRCAEVADKKIRLYAGAGIVAGSCPEKELAETGAKFNTMLNAMGIQRPAQ